MKKVKVQIQEEVDHQHEMLKVACHAIVDVQRSLKEALECLMSLSDRIDTKVDRLQAIQDAHNENIPTEGVN